MYKDFIAQTDCNCDFCSEEIQKGDHCYINNDYIICRECYNQEKYEDED